MVVEIPPHPLRRVRDLGQERADHRAPRRGSAGGSAPCASSATLRQTRATDWRTVGPDGVVIGAPMLGSPSAPVHRTRRYSPGANRASGAKNRRNSPRHQQDADRDQQRSRDRRRSPGSAAGPSRGSASSRSAPRPTRRNGTPRPSEYTASSAAPLTVPPVAAIARIPPSTGPMQGVHPAANATPSGSAPAVPGRTRSRSGRRSAYSRGDPRPERVAEHQEPEQRARRARPPAGTRDPRKNRTNVPANAPSSVKTIVNPRMNSRIGSERAPALALGRAAPGDERDVARAPAAGRTGWRRTRPRPRTRGPAPTTTRAPSSTSPASIVLSLPSPCSRIGLSVPRAAT